MRVPLIRRKLQPFHAELSVGEETRCGSVYTRAMGESQEQISLLCETHPYMAPTQSSIDKLKTTKTLEKCSNNRVVPPGGAYVR